MSILSDVSSSRRGKWIVLLAWVIVAGLIIPLAPTLQDITTNDTLQFLPEDAESKRAAELVRDRYPVDGTPAIIVFRNDAGLSEANFSSAEQIYGALAEMQGPDSNVAGIVSIFNIPQAREELVSADGTTMTMIATITGSPAEDPYAERIEAIRDVADRFNEDELTIRVSGPGGLIADLVSVFAEIDTFLLLVTVALVLVLLLLIYRSPVIAIVPLLIVGLVFQMAGGVAALILREIGFPVNGQSSGIMTVILFGAGTDYYLFISSRYREELRRIEDKHAAMKAAMRAVNGAILSAGSTLVLAALLLLLADLGSYQSLGPVVAIAIAIMMLAALTLVPAVLAIIGRGGFWPFQPRYEPEVAAEERHSRIWSWVAGKVLRRPGGVLAGVTALLVIMMSGMFFFELNYDSLESLPSNVDSVEGFGLLRESFPAGELAPTNVYIELPGGQTVYDGNLDTIARVSEALAATDGVVQVTGPAYPFGASAGPGPEQVSAAVEQIPGDVLEQLNALRGSSPEGSPPADGDERLNEAIGLYRASLQFLSTGREVARIQVVLDENPYGNAAMDMIPELRDAAEDAAASAGLSRDSVVVGGETAENFDTRVANVRDTLVVLPIVLLAIMLVLGLLLRSVVAALYLGATIVVTYIATLGLSLLVFTFVFGHDSLGSGVPFLLFVFLNALGVDYSIYLMSRIREESETRDLRHATELALERTGGVITSAGIILAGTFAALMSLPLRDLVQLGFAVSIGVLIDTFITRSLLVPSIVMLLGKWNWWPDRGRMAAAAETRSPSRRMAEPSPGNSS